MLKHVLVPLDGSALSEQALVYASKILVPEGKISLLSVIEEPLNYWYSPMDMPAMSQVFSEADYKDTYARVKNYLNSEAEKLREKGYKVECLIESGDPASLIHATASREKVDAIVITSHGRTGLSRWIFGSVTQKVINQMTCPIFLVPMLKLSKTEVVTEEEPQTSTAKQ